MPDTENVLTFGELRKKQKEEDREDELLDLDDKFLMRVSTYLDQKKDADGKSREYRNARRVLDKIVSLREEKIVNKARLAVKTDLEASKLDLLPEEQELFRDVKRVFDSHRKRIDESVENQGRVEVNSREEENSAEKEESEPIEAVEEDDTTEKEDDDESNPEESEEDESSVEEGYRIVKIKSDVPEFMGTDLEAYGPFDEGDKVEIPEDNAEILVNRGNAELVEE